MEEDVHPRKLKQIWRMNLINICLLWLIITQVINLIFEFNKIIWKYTVSFFPLLLSTKKYLYSEEKMCMKNYFVLIIHPQVSNLQFLASCCTKSDRIMKAEITWVLYWLVDLGWGQLSPAFYLPDDKRGSKQILHACRLKIQVVGWCNIITLRSPS